MSECCVAAAALIPNDRAQHRAVIAATLARFGTGALRFAQTAGIRVVPLRKSESYSVASPALARLGIDVDAWPAPPAGLFVVEERTVYLRSRSRMTCVHEFAHGLDCALGDGIYHSGIDPEIRAAFSGARAFVTPYAASSSDEYFAESVRAFVGNSNDSGSLWPNATRERLQRLDPTMHDICAALFVRFEETG